MIGRLRPKGSENVGGLQLKLTVTMSSLKPAGLGCLNAANTGPRVAGVLPGGDWLLLGHGGGLALEYEKRRGLIGDRGRGSRACDAVVVRQSVLVSCGLVWSWSWSRGFGGRRNWRRTRLLE